MEWQAHWIWNAGEPAPRNAVLYARKAFALARPLEAPRLTISADSRYLLYVNGERLGYGPARNYQAHYAYDSYDLSAHLVVGANVVAVAVLHWGEGTFQHLVARGGLLAQLDHAGGTLLTSGADWRVQRAVAFRDNTPRIACQLAWEEQFDARLEPVGWTEAGFDDHRWAAAVEVGPAGSPPWGTLSPRSVPLLTDEPVAPVELFALGTARRPAVVAAIHPAPYLAPGDLSARRHLVDAMIATTLHVPTAGSVTLKRCWLNGTPPRLFVGGRAVELRPAEVDTSATIWLEAGAHPLVLDWQGDTHDLDVTVTADGVAGLRVGSPLAAHAGTWAIARRPGATRAPALAATTVEALLACGTPWQAVAPADTPAVDVAMEVSASVYATSARRAARLPLDLADAGPGQARHTLIDFGRELVGWIELDIEAEAGATLDMLGYEGEQAGRRRLPEGLNNSMRYICRAGRQRFVSTVRRGFRYLLVAAHSAPSGLRLHSVRVRLATYPWNTQGEFRCDDPRLNQIWDMCAYTLRLCSEDTFTDCPAYEQTFWVGDACHSDVLVHQTVHGDGRLVARGLRLAAHSLERSPIVNSQVPSAWEDEPIPNWSWLWAMGCHSYYMLTADLALAQELYPALARQADTIAAARNADGLVALPGAWHFLDWGYPPDSPNDMPAHESCLAVGALHATAALADVVGAPDAARWRGLAGELSAAVNRLFWREERGAYADRARDHKVADTFSQPTNICALLTGVADEQRAAAILPYLVELAPGWIPCGTPWMFSIGCMLYAERGRMAEVLPAIRERWGAMLDRGATTTWETFIGHLPGGVLPSEAFPEGAWTRSWCHAWSALPAYLLSAFVLGVRPLEPGYRRALIAPQLCGLRRVEGRVPTPYGPIDVRVEAGDVTRIRVQLPPGVAALLRLPAAEQRRPQLEAGLVLTQDDQQWVVELPHGCHTTIGY